jgi:hypothetical protein
MKMKIQHLAWALLGLWAICMPALAHKPSDSYLTLGTFDSGRVDVEWHVSLRDIDGELRLDVDDDGRLTWGEVRGRWAELLGYMQAHLSLSQRDRPCALVPGSDQPPTLASHTDGRYAVLRWQQACMPTSGDIRIDYTLFALTDPTHRGIVRWRAQLPATTDRFEEKGITVLGGDRPAHRLQFATRPAPASLSVASDAPIPGSGLASSPDPDTASSTAETPPTPACEHCFTSCAKAWSTSAPALTMCSFSSPC